MTQPRNIPKLVHLHCTATPDDDNTRVTIESIRQYHMKEKGYQDIGYHFVIRRDGGLEIGRKIDLYPASIEGHNVDAVAVAYIGSQKPSTAQISTLLVLADRFSEDFGLDQTKWVGHYELNPHKLCPGIDMELVRALVAEHLARKKPLA